MEDYDLDDQFGDYPSWGRSGGGPGCFTVVFVGAILFLGVNWLAEAFTGRPLSEWFGLAIAGAAVAWFYLLIFVVPVLGIIALIVGNVLDLREWRKRRASRKR